MKGNPYDNAVAGATFKLFKTEFMQGMNFDSLGQLSLELSDYVNWFNNIRIHSSLDYMSSVEYKLDTLKKVSSLVLTYQLFYESITRVLFKYYSIDGKIPNCFKYY